MLETRDLYKDYINAIQTKLNTVKIKISQYEGSQAYIKNCIINNRTEFEKVDVSIDTLFANPYIAYAKIKELTDNGQLTRVAHYVKSYVNSVRYVNLHKLLYDRLSKCIMPYEVYLKFIGIADLEIAKYILEGGTYTFGHAGKIFIKEKERTFFFKGKPVPLPVDWGNTMKNKKFLQDKGEVLYNAAKSPEGKKWFMYHTSDYAYWWWWEVGGCWDSNAGKNRGFFRFIPSKFQRRGNKKGLPFISKEEIINTTEIGNINKMLELMRIDPSYYLKYRREEKVKVLNLVNKI